MPTIVFACLFPGVGWQYSSITCCTCLMQNANAISSTDYFNRDEAGAPIMGDSDVSAAELVNRLSYQVCMLICSAVTNSNLSY